MDWGLVSHNSFLPSQYHCGHGHRSEVWVFGMVDTSQSPALGVMNILADRSVATLLPIMQQHLHGGTTVHRAAYYRVQQLSLVASHSTVNHSLHFLDPTTGVHTQNVESYWNRVKAKFKRMKGVYEDMLDSHMDEFMWRERNGRRATTVASSDICLRYSQ